MIRDNNSRLKIKFTSLFLRPNTRGSLEFKSFLDLEDLPSKLLLFLVDEGVTINTTPRLNITCSKPIPFEHMF